MAEVGTSEKQANSIETKAFLSIVVNEPWTEKQKTLILEKITSDLKTWIQESSKVDLEQELNTFLSQDVKQDSDNCATYVTDNFELNILYNPSSAILSTSIAKLKNAHYAHFIYSGVVLQGSGDWPLKEETYTSGKFASEITALGNKDLELVLCAFNQGKWTQNGLLKKGLTSLRKLVVNPDGGSVETPQYVDAFTSYIQNMLVFEDVTTTLEASRIVGNVRFNRPTLYIFPAGEGDSAFFGISGFTFMANGGYSRQSCFWPFVKHLDRIDALLVTHLNSDNLFGVNSMLERKLTEKIHPNIGTTLFNAPSAKTPSTIQKDSLYVNMADVASGIVDNLGELNVNRLNCFASKDITKPLNLYQKLGYGSLDLYVLNPQQDSKEIKDFLSQWSKRVDSFSQQKTVSKSKGKEAMISLTHLVSVSVILVWRPASPKDNIVRILFPGNCPQNKLLDSLEKLKSLDIFRKLNCTEESLTFKKPSTTPPLSSKSTSSVKTDLKKPPPVKDTKPEAKKNIPPKDTKPELKKPLTTTRDAKSKIDRTTPAPGPSKRAPLSASKSVDVRPTSATSRQVLKKQQTVTSATTVSAPAKKAVEKTTKAEISKRPPVGRPLAKPKDKLTKKEPVKKEAKPSPKTASVSKETGSPKSVEQPPQVINGDPNLVENKPNDVDECQKVTKTEPNDTKTENQEVEELKTDNQEVEAPKIEKQEIEAPKTEPQELVTSETVDSTENGMENIDRTPADGSGDPGSIDINEAAKSSNGNESDNVTDEQKTDLKTESIEQNSAENVTAENANVVENVNNGNGVETNKTDDNKQETIGEAVDVKDLPTEMTASLIGSLDANDNKNEKPTQLDTSLPEGVDPPMSLPPPPPKTTGRMSIGGRPPTRSTTVTDSSSRSNSSRMSLPPRTNGASFAEARRLAASFNVDLAYIPCHGDPHHVDSAFFSKIKAKHYVLSSLSPSLYILDAFLDGLTEGEDEVQLIPTYESPIMRNWMAVREEDLKTKNVKIAPSASRCGIQLQDNEIGCPAFRLEF